MQAQASAADRQAGPAPLAPLAALQFVAIAWVVLNQFRIHLGLHAGDRSGLVFKGYLGAELFFVAAGFATAHGYARALAGHAFHYGAFLWTRLIRVYPLHLAMIAVMAALAGLAARAGAAYPHALFSLHGLVSNLLMIQAWGPEPSVSWNFPSWLISATWFAYVVFPLTAWLTLRLARPTLVAVIAPVALFAVLFQIAAARGVLFTDMTAQIGAAQTIPAFLFGAGLYRLWRERTAPSGWGAAVAAAAGAWIVAAALMRLSDLAIVPAFGALTWGLAETAKGQRPALGEPLMLYLGRIALPMCLVYLPVDIVYFHAIARLFGQPAGALAWAAWAGVFPVILAAAIAAHHLIQAPAQAWLARLAPALTSGRY
jgi:peptidoglycan/LPS O-acetylase OafA/YrhL